MEQTGLSNSISSGESNKKNRTICHKIKRHNLTKSIGMPNFIKINPRFTQGVSDHIKF